MQEKPMSHVATSPNRIYSFEFSNGFEPICLFCLLGLLLSAAILPLVPAEQLSWLMLHIE
jgi:hypothetical protein